MPKLLRILYDRLDPPARDSLSQAVALAVERGVDLYLVGGAVRDLLLGSAHFDVDLVVVGDAIGLAADVGKRLRCRVVSHPRFATATVKGEGYRLDVARARSERYERPGALPIVAPSELVDDLARRDFTINAMALKLAGVRAGRLIDLHGGQADLEAGLIRVLHDRSFQDDATRILRAARYAGRLGLRLERDTARLLRRDAHYLRSISGARLRHEFERIAQEEQVGKILSLVAKLGALTSLEPLICASARQMKMFSKVASAGAPNRREAWFFCFLLWGEPSQQIEAQISRLSLTGHQASAVRACARLRAREGRLSRSGLKPSQIVELLSDTPSEATEAFALLTDNRVVRDRLRLYHDDWRSVRPRLNGRDIEALGVAHGPDVGAALAALRTARLDGLVSTRDDEVMFVEKFRARSRASRTRHG